MINIDIPDNKSVIVFSSFRTRSTALCDWIAQQKGLVNFDEAFVNVSRAISFVNFVGSSSDKFVIKVMCSANQYSPEIQQFLQPLLDRCTIIRLHRQDVFVQIISFYIAVITNRWHYVEQLTGDHTPMSYDQFSTEVLIDYAQLKKSAITILTSNQRLQNINVRVDLDLTAENLGVLPCNYQLIPKPLNTRQLTSALHTLINTDLEVGNLYRNT